MNNRELKFRAFYQNKLYMQEYCGGFSYFIHNDSDALTLEDIFVAAERQKCIIQQYTGLKDKNGKEIYEGDIIQYHRCDSAYLILKSVVYFYNGQFGFDLKGFNDMFFALGDEVCPEIVGNIFENPDYFKNNE